MQPRAVCSILVTGESSFFLNIFPNMDKRGKKENGARACSSACTGERDFFFPPCADHEKRMKFTQKSQGTKKSLRHLGRGQITQKTAAKQSPFYLHGRSSHAPLPPPPPFVTLVTTHVTMASLSYFWSIFFSSPSHMEVIKISNASPFLSIPTV